LRLRKYSSPKEWRQCRQRGRRASTSPERLGNPPPKRVRVPTRRPSDPSGCSGGEIRPLVGFEWPDVDCRRRHPHPASRVTWRKGRRKTGDKRSPRGSGVLDRSPPIYLAKKRRGEGEGCGGGGGRTKFGRRAALKCRSREKNPYRRCRRPGAGPGTRRAYAEGADSPLPPRARRVRVIIRRHGNARPIGRLDAPWVFLFLLSSARPSPTALLLNNPFETTLVREPAPTPFSRAERMALVKLCFLPFEVLRSAALATLERESTEKTRGREGS